MTEGFGCRDCGLDTLAIGEYYMVEDGVWCASGLRGNGGMLCVSCLESRLGRRLVPLDFPDAPVNNGMFPQSDRLLDRLDRPTTT